MADFSPVLTFSTLFQFPSPAWFSFFPSPFFTLLYHRFSSSLLPAYPWPTSPLKQSRVSPLSFLQQCYTCPYCAVTCIAATLCVFSPTLNACVAAYSKRR